MTDAAKDAAALQLFERFLVTFGDPKTANLPAYIDEYAKALAGFAEADLMRAGDYLIRTARFFPRPAEVLEIVRPMVLARQQLREAAEAAAQEIEVRAALAKRTDEDRAKVAALFRDASHLHAQARDVVVPVDRPAFEAMREHSKNRHLHEARKRRT
jgi:hypothetical protein